ncbi:MAG: DUF2520 domain-containing protein [Acidobacteriaceae bacterium]|nr:DUF2520 domain-containing protein [Acidobacteriaceae bacterium]
MKKQLPLGLIAEGNLTSSSILRLPSVIQELGPVKSKALRLARRASNYLQAGWAVDGYEDLQETRLILVHVPDESARRVIDELCASELDMSSLMFAFGETWMPADVLEPLRSRGAATATIIHATSSRRNWFVAEGTTPAVRMTRKLIERSEARVLQIQTGRKPLYFAAELLASALPAKLFAHAEQALRDAGITGNHLRSMLEDMAHEMFRTYANAARLTWAGPLGECSEDVAHMHFQSLRDYDPELADYIELHIAAEQRMLEPEAKQPKGDARLPNSSER